MPIQQRLDHLAYLGVDALWLSPIYPSPLADFGYDVSDYTSVDPRLGTLDDLDALVREAHALGLKVLLDLVPSHTSTDHPWFREHPERYVWSPVDGPPNNWVSAFGGPACAQFLANGVVLPNTQTLRPVLKADVAQARTELDKILSSGN